MISCLPRRSWRSIGSFDPLLGALRPQQASSTQVKIRKCEVYGQPMRVFRKSTIANFCKTKDALENVEDMLDARTHARFRTIRFALLNGKILRTRRMRLREVRRARRFVANHCGLTTVRRIAPHTSFIAMQQVRQHAAVVHVCRRRNERMNEPALAINADMRLGEWREGIAPSRSLRTVREPLNSYGSHHPTAVTEPSEQKDWVGATRCGEPILALLCDVAVGPYTSSSPNE